MEYQIVLLPRQRYWDWVRACREYVRHYGPNLTQDPGIAARYMAPVQVITFPVIPGAYPEQGDIEDWFQQTYPGIRLDPISVSDPGELEAELSLRVEQADRYGQRRRPFYLLWPTDYAVITQKFGANPQIYTRFGMPGHEGLDFRALNNTNIYCCADGEVYLVHTNPKSHAYGIHVRIRHKDGYKTVYGHLAIPLVKVGQEVSAGQVIGKANSTGASTGSHLHLTLKRDGATKRGETIYPKDVIDPTPFMVWPERSTKSIPRPRWPMEKCLAGIHPRTTGLMTSEDMALLRKLEPEAVMLRVRELNETLDKLREINPVVFILVNIDVDLSYEPMTPEQFFSLTDHDVGRLYKHGVRYFEIGSDPNLQNHGYRRSWANGFEFAQWFQSVLRMYQSRYQEACFGFPGLSPGEEVSGWREEHLKFLSEAEGAISDSDWIGVHAYWLDELGMRSPNGGRIYDVYRNRFPGELLFITEFNNPAYRLTSKQRAEQYHEYIHMVREEDGVGAAFLYALSSENDALNFTLNRKGQDADDWVLLLKSEVD
jgi:murein DD-endopeptidase MepM/ murein hydrolase activator NlpD